MPHTISGTPGFGITLASDLIDQSVGGGNDRTVGGSSLIGSTLYGSYASGVVLTTNPETIASGVTISSASNNVTGVYGSSPTDWTLVNYGLISELTGFDINYGVSFTGGGTITNAAGGRIYGYTDGIIIENAGGSVSNQGTILSVNGLSGGFGVYLPEGGAVTNGVAASVVSSAYIHGYLGGIRFTSANASTLTNYGTVSGLTGYQGVVMNSGTVINGASTSTGALIHGGSDAIDITGVATVVNYGTILGSTTLLEPTTFYGIKLIGSGTISNLGSASLIQSYVGIYAQANVTVTNAGSIRADTSASDAIRFASGTNRLIVDPGAVFYGIIDGGAAATTVLELESGAGTRTMAGFGSSIVNFSSIVFDPASNWLVSGDDSANGLGTLGISGFTFGDTIHLDGFVATSRTFSSGKLVLTAANSSHETLAFTGSLYTGDFRITNVNGGTDVNLQAYLTYAQTIDLAGTIATSETVSNGTMTLYNGISNLGTLLVGTSLSGGDFTLASDGGGGTDVIVSSVIGTYSGTGVSLVVPRTTIATGASIGGSGSYVTGVYGAGGTTWTLTNRGQINETGGGDYGIGFAGGGTITNTSTGTIFGYQYDISIAGVGAVTNLGKIAYGHNNAGIVLSGGGTVTNGANVSGASVAYISGYAYGVRFLNVGNDSLTNFGTIGGPGGKAVSLITGSVINGSSIATRALIDGVIGVRISGATGTVTNYGTISSPDNGQGQPLGGYSGIYLLAGGAISNVGSASLIEGFQGIVGLNGDTVTNAGTIASSQGTLGIAVYFKDGANKLIVDPGATFIGSIHGGTSASAVMELAAGGVGSISGFGTSITNFSSVVIDSGARWTIGGDDSANGMGTVTISGFTSGDTIQLNNFVATSRTFSSGKLILTAANSAHQTLSLAGGFYTGDFRISNVTGATDVNLQAYLTYAQTIDLSGTIATSETVTNGTMTLYNGLSNLGTLLVGTSLSTGDFTLASDGGGGTDVIVSSVIGSYVGTGVTLAVPSTTIASTASIGGTVSYATAVYGAGGTTWTLTNEGQIDETGHGAYGIRFAGGGTITNTSTGTIFGAGYGISLAGAGAVTNLGKVSYGTQNSGIVLSGGGTVINGADTSGASAAYIGGYFYGIRFQNVGNDSVVNFGTIDGPGGKAVSLVSGSVVNGSNSATAAKIDGIIGVRVSSGAGTVTNYGTITSPFNNPGSPPGFYTGIYLVDGGTISNLGAASRIEGFVGLVGGNGVTVTNAGTIASNQGTVGSAVYFENGANKLIVDPGARFIGSIYGGASANAVMELAAGSAGSIYGFGTSISNFGSVVFDSGAQWTIGGTDSASGLGTLEITGFTQGDTIALTGFVELTDTFTSGLLVLTNAGGQHATLHVDGAFTADDFHFSAGPGSGTDIIVCFAEGTHIATPSGQRGIETLSPGDMVLTHFGGPTPIEWIGRRHVDCVRHPDPNLALPVRVAAGAFGSAGPDRDLFLSPNHAVCVLGDLIPIRCLINGGSIARVSVDSVTYYHIELERHDMVWAEGLLAESYLDVGDRANFSNGGEPMRLFPDFASAGNNAMLWEAKGCAPLVVHGPRLEAARAWVDAAARESVRAAA